MALTRLLKRSEFLAVAATQRKWVRPGVIVQILFKDSGEVRYGLTASRHVGGAVVRNRARRRLRPLAERLIAEIVSLPADIVLIARPETATLPSPALEAQVREALQKLLQHKDKPAPARRPRGAG